VDARSPINPLAYREAGYIAASKHTGLALVPARYRTSVQCHFADVIELDQDADVEWFERASLLLLIGAASLERFCPLESSRDGTWANELLFKRMLCLEEAPFTPTAWNETRSLLARLQAEAAEFVRAHAPEIAKTAAELR
jgi:hypothetical protein